MAHKIGNCQFVFRTIPYEWQISRSIELAMMVSGGEVTQNKFDVNCVSNMCSTRAMLLFHVGNDNDGQEKKQPQKSMRSNNAASNAISLAPQKLLLWSPKQI